MPGSLPTESDFERYRTLAAADTQGKAPTDAEVYKKKVQGDHDDGEDEYDEDEPHEEGDDDGADDFGDQLDFSSVPVRPASSPRSRVAMLTIPPARSTSEPAAPQ